MSRLPNSTSRPRPCCRPNSSSRQQQQQQTPRTAQQQDRTAPAASNRSSGPQHGGRRNNSVHTAAASLETVERALGDLRVANGTGTTATTITTTSGTGGHHRHGRRGAGQGAGNNAAAHTAGTNSDIKAGDLKVPTTDFDFQGSNALFDKAALSQRNVKDSSSAGGQEATDDGVGEGVEGEGGKAEKGEVVEGGGPVAYNPQKSFFDSLSSSTSGPPSREPSGNVGRGGRRGGGGAGKNRREEEREKNVATFGEPGGVGLMGPGVSFTEIFVRVQRLTGCRRICRWMGRVWEKGSSTSKGGACEQRAFLTLPVIFFSYSGLLSAFTMIIAKFQ